MFYFSHIYNIKRKSDKMRNSLNNLERTSSSTVDDSDGNFKGLKNSGLLCHAIMGLSSCACLGAVITFAVYLGIYTFNNPDP